MTSEFSKYSFLRDFNFSQMDRRIVMQQATLVNDDLGGLVESWQEVHNAWAKFVDMSNLKNTDLYRRKVKYCIIIRYNPIITPQLRILHQGVIYIINEIINVQSKYMIITIMEDLHV